MTEAIVAEDISFSYDGRTKVLDHLSFAVRKGEILGIMGLSGCGKSTLCYCLCGVIPHGLPGTMEGNVYLFGRNTRELCMPEMARMVGMVFQDPDAQLFLPRVDYELAFGPENLCLPPERIREIIGKVSEMLGLGDWLDRSPHELSGGQKQILALGAVLSLDPDVLVLDEALSQLDEENSLRVQSIIVRLRQRGKTIVVAEHNVTRLGIADRVMALKDGKILKIGLSDEVLSDEELIKQCYGLC